jgi:hypothetical protein
VGGGGVGEGCVCVRGSVSVWRGEGGEVGGGGEILRTLPGVEAGVRKEAVASLAQRQLAYAAAVVCAMDAAGRRRLCRTV